MTTLMATITRPSRARRPPSARGHEPGADGLVDRDRERGVLEQCLRDARAGVGGVVFLEAPAGGGKSRLLGAARELAGRLRMQILTAAGAELEREFPFGLAMQLFAPLLSPPGERGESLPGTAQLAATLLDDAHAGGSTEPDGRQYSIIHGLFQATRTLVDGREDDRQTEGMAIVIDDLHWADRSSLRFVAYLAERVAELPIAIVLSARSGEASADPRALATLRRAAGDGLLALAPLGEDGIARVVRRFLADAGPELCASCARASGGNPFLLTELVAVLAEDANAPLACHPGAVEEIVPDAVRRAAAARLHSMAPATRAVAEAVAVLGENALVRRIARLAELDCEAVVAAADELAAMQVLSPGVPLSFVQPVLGSAIGAALAPLQSARVHRRAAQILAEEHAGAELVAAHLLHAPADGDPATAIVLDEAAEAALRRHDPERAMLLIERALAEDPEPTLRAELLVAIARACVLEGLKGAPRGRVTELAERAWSDETLLQSPGAAALGVPILATGLLIADELERAVQICDAALDRDGDELLPRGELIACARAGALYEQGRLAEAEAAATAALDGLRSRPRGYAQSAIAVLARCHIERGRLEQAESLLAAIERDGSSDPVCRALMLDARSQLRLAQHRPEDALRDAMHAGATLEEQFPGASPGSIAWRSSAALAHLALGEPERARELVEHELEHARRIGVTRVVSRGLRILGLARSGAGAGIEELAEAVAIGGSCPSTLEYARALIDYGATLRRSGRRADAREPLRLGLDLSHRGGASVLEARARTELIASGARPRRPLVAGVDSLTVSQRRVAELAARGLTTRQIAGALYVTPKTVEFHLRQIYLKLGVASRQELAKELAASSAAEPVGRAA